MKKIFLGIVFSLLIVTTAFAKTEQVTIDGNTVTLAVEEQNGRRLYPLRAICNALGIQIVSVEGSRIQLQQGDNVVYYFIGEKLVANNTGYFNTDAATVNVNNTVYVPIRTLGYMFGYNIDVVNGDINLTKVVSFTQPKATYGSGLLMKDITIAEDIVETVDPQYYLAALKGAITDYNWSYISECKQYILNDRSKISDMARDLQTQSGKAVYNASIAFLDSIYDTLCCMELWDFSEASKALGRVTSACNQLISKREALVDAVYKVSKKI